jgi:dsRNA-specific ribonuclease
MAEATNVVSAQAMAATLTGFEWVRGSLDGDFLRAKMAEILHLPRAEQNRLAFLGDRIINMAVAHHLFSKWSDSETELNMHRASQEYVTGKVLAKFFDEFKLETPATGNARFSTHTKADKLEALAAFMYQNSSWDVRGAEMFSRLMRRILDEGDRACAAIDTKHYHLYLPNEWIHE